MIKYTATIVSSFLSMFIKGAMFGWSDNFSRQFNSLAMRLGDEFVWIRFNATSPHPSCP